MKTGKKKNSEWKTGDHVWVRSTAGECIPNVQVELISREVREPRKGNTISWPGWTGWNARLISKSEVDMLRKRWCIPYRWPDERELFVFEEDIIGRVKRTRGGSP